MKVYIVFSANSVTRNNQFQCLLFRDPIDTHNHFERWHLRCSEEIRRNNVTSLFFKRKSHMFSYIYSIFYPLPEKDDELLTQNTQSSTLWGNCFKFVLNCKLHMKINLHIKVLITDNSSINSKWGLKIILLLQPSSIVSSLSSKKIIFSVACHAFHNTE